MESRKHPAPHDRTSSSEVGACDPAHSGSERMGDASPRSDDDARRPHVGESGAEERFSVLFHGTSADALGLKGVAAKCQLGRGIATVGELVRGLAALQVDPDVSAHAIKAVRKALQVHAIRLAGVVGAGQVDELSEVSGSRDFVFDAFGRLCQVDAGLLAANPASGAGPVGDATPTTLLDLPQRLIRVLERQGYQTLGQVRLLSDEDLLAMRGVGPTAVAALRALLAEHAVGDVGAEDGIAADAPVDLDPKAIEGARLALSVREGRLYPVLSGSFMACMPAEAQWVLGPGLGADSYCAAIMGLVESADGLVEACEGSLIDELVRLRGVETPDSMADVVPTPQDPVWQVAAEHVAQEDPWCAYDEERRTLEVRHPRVSDWLDAAPMGVRNKKMLRMCLGGATLNACGEEFGVTRERVRQIARQQLKTAPVLEEDRLRHFYEAYGLQKSEFCLVTGEPVATYVYLRATRAKGSKRMRVPLARALDDERVPTGVRDRIRRLLDEGYLYVDGVRIPMRRDSILNHIAMHGATDSLITMERLRELYEEFLAEHALCDVERLRFGSDRLFEVCVDRCGQIMRLPHSAEVRYGGSVRFYDPSGKDFQPLVDELESVR